VRGPAAEAAETAHRPSSKVHSVRRVTLLIVPVLALVLSGCGSSGPRPGTALQLDDLRVTTRHVDDVASRYCAALATVGTKASAEAVRTQVVGALAGRLVAERFAEVRGIEPGSSYASDLTKLRAQLASFDEDTQDAIVEVEGAQSFVSAVVDKAGEDSFRKWLGDQDVAVNPVFGMKLDGVDFSSVDPSLSVAASELAKSAVDSAANPTADASGVACA
jgi:hypothetical protein